MAVVVPILWEFLIHRKQLTCGVGAIEALTNVSMPGIEISYKGTPVPNAHLCTFKITNSGKVPITQAEYDAHRPITIQFKPVGSSQTPPRVLVAEVSEKKSKDLLPSISTVDNQITIEPLLLNRGEWFSVRALLDSQPSPSPTVGARISGIGQVEVSSVRPSMVSVQLIAGLVVYALGGAEVLALGQYFPGLATMLVGIIIMLLSILFAKRLKSL